MTTTDEFRAGFVALVGRPNVGKSTLMNALVGEKLAIVTPKPQTTRHRMLGILNLPHAQVAVMDTPGLCSAATPLSKALRQTAGAAASSADMTLVIAEVRGETPSLSDADHEVLRMAANAPGDVVLAINKVDLLPRKELLLPWIATYAAQYNLAAVVPISARREEGLEALLGEITKRLPVSAPMFPLDMHTDAVERFLCAELIREQLLMQTQQEVPHCAAVVVETFEDYRDDPKPLCHLEARIYVERDSQKAIVIGKGGHQIKALGQRARASIEALLDAPVYLKLTAHVDKSWTKNERALKRYGLSGEGGGKAPKAKKTKLKDDIKAALQELPQ